MVPTVFGSFRCQPPVVSESIGGGAALSLDCFCFLPAVLSWQHGDTGNLEKLDSYS